MYKRVTSTCSHRPTHQPNVEILTGSFVVFPQSRICARRTDIKATQSAHHRRAHTHTHSVQILVCATCGYVYAYFGRRERRSGDGYGEYGQCIKKRTGLLCRGGSVEIRAISLTRYITAWRQADIMPRIAASRFAAWYV